MRSITLFISFLLLAACGQKETNTPPKNNPTSESPLSEFLHFYEQFHEDSLFQIEHILFPLDGAPSMLNGESTPNNFKWQREEWLMQHPLDPNGEFKQKINPIDSSLIIEFIIHKNGKYAMERRFAKLGKEWKLIYYMDLNPFRQ